MFRRPRSAAPETHSASSAGSPVRKVTFMSDREPGCAFGVKSALVAGLGAVAVMNDHVAWQDYGGADDIVQGLDAKSADAVLDALHI